ncbi:MAG: hypothetical protein HYR55_17295 [Acidobacteria bacterium]|nr:hypothetical protein [Acidobacteriota bacterium]
MKSNITGAPIRAGQASPLRVATGGDASWCSKALAAARLPARIYGASTVNKYVAQGLRLTPSTAYNLDSFRTLFYV